MSIFFREYGEGKPIILIHGFCETHQIWDGFDKRLSRYGRVISIDLPGFGKSPLPESTFSIDLIADLVLSWLKEKKIIEPILVGHSLGGYVILAMAARAPELYKKLVLFHSTVFDDSEEKKANRNKIIDFVSKNGVEPFIQTFVPSLFFNKSHPDLERVKAMSLQTPPATLLGYTKAMRDRPSREQFFMDFKNSVLILAGKEDEVIPEGVSKKMASLNEKSILSILPDTGHMGMIESDELAAEKIGQFVAK